MPLCPENISHVIIFGWSFLVFVIFLPFCWYGSLFSVAKFLHVRQLTSLDDKAVDSLESFTADKTTETPDYQIVEKAVIAEDH